MELRKVSDDIGEEAVVSGQRKARDNLARNPSFLFLSVRQVSTI
jgi:hypothetical protein